MGTRNRKRLTKRKKRQKKIGQQKYFSILSEKKQLLTGEIELLEEQNKLLRDRIGKEQEEEDIISNILLALVLISGIILLFLPS